MKKEGDLRELIRRIQAKRKEMGLKPNQSIRVTVPKEFQPFKEEIKRKVVASNINFGESLIVEI